MSDPTEKDGTDPETEAEAVEAQATKDPITRIADALEGMLKMNTITLWMQQYTRLDAAVTADTLASMKIIIDEFILPEYKFDLRRNLSDGEYDEKLKIILMKQRIYEYLLFVHNFQAAFPTKEVFPDAHAAAARWLRELVTDRDFRMVHMRQGVFYPNFTAKIQQTIRAEADRLERLGSDFSRIVSEMRDFGEMADGNEVYHKYSRDRDKEPARYALIEEAGRERGYRIPLSLRHFRYLWSLGLNHLTVESDETLDVN